MPIVLPSPTRPTLTEPTYFKPPVWKPLLAWVGLAFGALVVVAAVGLLGEGIRQSVGLFLLGLALLVPGGWWIHCERKDRTHAEEDFQLDRQAALAQQAMAGYVAPNALAPLTWDTPLTAFTRRWPVVGTASVALLVASVAVLPSVEAEPAAASPSPVTSTVATTMTTTMTPTTLPPASAAVAEDSGIAATEVAVAEAAVVPEPRPSEPVPAPAAPAPADEPAPNYAPAPVPLAAVPPAAYYPNCTAARAAGVTPLLRGQPGYASKLDRDNDGVACE